MNRTRVRAIFARLRLRAEDARDDRSIDRGRNLFNRVYSLTLQQVFFDALFHTEKDEKKRCWIIFHQNIYALFVEKKKIVDTVDKF